MSELPQIDPAKIAQRLVTKNGELTYQVTQLEVLAEALRDQRDNAEATVAELTQKLAAAESQTPVADIPSLPPEKG